jgi:general secretion pathway protein H
MNPARTLPPRCRIRSDERERGFSLLEILLVVSIMAMIFAFVPRMFGSGVSGSELKSNVRSIVSAMRVARDTAINTRRDAFVTLNVDSRELTMSPGDRIVKLNDRLTLKLFTSQADQINETTASFRFYPDGSSNGGRVTVVANEREFAVDVDWLTGRVTVEDSADPKRQSGSGA